MSDFPNLEETIVTRFRQGLDRAVDNGIPEPTAMTLATADEQGRPAARTVLLKGMDAEGFVFYTNLGSRKGRHLQAHDNVSLVFWWRENAEQVLIDGRAEPVGDQEADAYFASRPRGSQIGAWASMQSQPMASRAEFLARVASFEKKFEGREVPRPEHWSGFRVKPRRIEFWYGREFRLHERVCFELVGRVWQESLLYP